MPYASKFFLWPFGLLIICFLFTCGSTVNENLREESILNRATKDSEEKYARLLVDQNLYTTKGGELQKKFYRHLIGIAGEISEKRQLTIIPGTIGFYYDKKSGDKTRLYMGLDIQSGRQFPATLTDKALQALRKDVGIVMHTMDSCRSIFREDDVAGMVIGWRWSNNKSGEFVSLWIEKSDMTKYVNLQLTVEEVIHRSTVTNSEGKIIRLPL